MEPLHKLSLSYGGIFAITEPFTNFSFTRWNSGYHGAFYEILLSHNGILAITEPFTNFLFRTMEFWRSRSLLKLSRIFHMMELTRHMI
jgi:hypothetical protein